MSFAKIQDVLKKMAGTLPKKNAEKFIFKILSILLVFVMMVVFGIRILGNRGDDVEKIISDTVTKIPISFSVSQDEMKTYDCFLRMSQYPEPLGGYALGRKRDPFSKYFEKTSSEEMQSTVHDFTLESVGHVALPLTYKGFIELPERLIGQINWENSTRFVEKGDLLDGYRIIMVSKEKINAVDKDGREWEFLLNKPILSDRLNAVLYDRISAKTYVVENAGVIDDYKVIDIQPDCVILLLDNLEIKLTK